MKIPLTVKNNFESLLKEIQKITLDFLISPCELGLFGFAFLFTVILFTKILMFFYNSQQVLQVSLDDVKISLIGFLAFYFYSLIKHFKKY